MGMFERLGEKVERFKQEAVAARDESAEYACRNCETVYHSEVDACTECGSNAIVHLVDDDAGADEPAAEAGDDDATGDDDLETDEPGDDGESLPADPDVADLVDEAEAGDTDDE